MSGPFGSQHWMYTSGGFYNHTIDQSLRFNDDDGAYLKRDITSSTNRRTWTWSAWVKRANLGGSNGQYLFTDGKSSQLSELHFDSNDQLRVQLNVGSSKYKLSNQVFRDTSAFYHIVWRVDTTQATAENRSRIYVNGTQITSWSTEQNVNQDTDTTINLSGNDHQIGGYSSGTSRNFDGYMAEVNFIDGISYGPENFGETSNGVWVPKKYTGSYSDNSFHLDFSASSFTDNGSDPDVFADQAGSNNFNAYNLAATDIVPDSPTNNWCTNNGAMRANITHSEGNLKMVGVGNNYDNMAGTFEVDVEDTDGWYWEYYSVGNDTATSIGIAKSNNAQFNQSDPSAPFTQENNGEVSYQGSGNKAINTGVVDPTSYGNSWTAGDVISVAVKAGAVYFYKNGTIQNSGTAALTGITGKIVPAFAINGTNSGIANYGQDSTFAGAISAGGNSDANGLGDFKYTVPSGYKALCASNIPEPTIGPNNDTQSDDNFNTVLYTGDGSTSNAITGVGFQPDFLWIKQRSATRGHQLMDSVRGAAVRLQSHGGTAESVSALSSFDSDGFTVTVTGSDGSTLNGTNINSGTFVGWSWKGGGSAVSNSNGDLTSQVSANTDAGFSIATFTMPDAQKTIGHGLGVKPDMIIFKLRSAGNWMVWHKSFGENTNDVILLDTTAAKVDSGGSGGNWFRSITSTITEIKSAGSYAGIGNYVMYSFASVEGYSRIGSYTGNGNADGTFVYTGFRPAWVMVKRSSAAGGWHMFDNKRPNAYNVIDKRLEADNSDAENSTSGCLIDLVSNGFKFRGTFDNINGSGATHIYLAFAEAPFKYANAR